jgi:hypothetical protein
VSDGIFPKHGIFMGPEFFVSFFGPNISLNMCDHIAGTDS